MKINRTALRSIEMLKLISQNPEGIGLEEICEKMNIPKTSAYDIATTLVYTGMADIRRDSRIKYHIGLNAYRIGMSYANNRDMATVLEPVLKPFSRELGKTVFYGIQSGNSVVYLSKFEPENPIITTATVGSKNPVHRTSLGKAIMSAMEEEELKELVSGLKFEKHTEHSIMSREKLMENISLSRKRGYALDERELEEHMECVGAPVLDQEGRVIGAISASSLYKPSEDYDALGRRIAEKALEISGLLGYRA